MDLRGEVDGVKVARLGLAAGMGGLAMVSVLGVRGGLALQHPEVVSAHSLGGADGTAQSSPPRSEQLVAGHTGGGDRRSRHRPQPVGLRRTNRVGPG